MSRANFLRLFPTPRYLAMPAAGIDISDQSVKFIQLASRGSRIVIERYGEKPIPPGIIESGAIREPASLIQILNELKREHRLTEVVASMPEEEAYIVHLSLPALKPDELRGSIELQLEEHVPLPAGETVFDYEIIESPRGKQGNYELAVSALPERTVKSYTEVLTSARLRPVAFEIEAHAIARAIIPAGEDRLVLIVDFGKTRTSFFIACGWTIVFSATAKNIGGEDITTAVQKGLSLPHEEAERLKVERGLLTRSDHREAFFAMMPIVSVLRDEITKHQNYWETHRGEHGRLARHLEEIIICGGQATLPGLIDYLNMNLDLPVTLGNPWRNLFSFEKYIPPINLNQALRYTTAIGLSLRTLTRLT